MNAIRLVADNVISDSDFESLCSWLGTKPRLSQGVLVKEFEAEFAAWLGVKHAVFCNSGSSANLLAYAALIETGRVDREKDSVYAPAVAWPTTIAPALQYGLRIALGDAETDTWGLSTVDLEERLTRGPTARPRIVTVVDVLGVPADRDRLMTLQNKYGFYIIEDCCGAHGATFRKQKVGTFGDLSAFSFYIGHHITSGEGGMICTNDDSLDRTLRQLRAHGWAIDLSTSAQKALAAGDRVDPFRERFTFRLPGYNLRSTEFAAKLGRLQLPRLDAACTARLANYQHYVRRLDAAKFQFPYNPNGTPSPIGFAFLAKSQEHRDQIAMRLTEANVEHRPVGGGNMARQPFLARYPRLVASPARGSFADKIHDCAIQVPVHPGLSEADIDRVCAAVKGDA